MKIINFLWTFCKVQLLLLRRCLTLVSCDQVLLQSCPQAPCHPSTTAWVRPVLGTPGMHTHRHQVNPNGKLNCMKCAEALALSVHLGRWSSLSSMAVCDFYGLVATGSTQAKNLCTVEKFTKCHRLGWLRYWVPKKQSSFLSSDTGNLGKNHRHLDQGLAVFIQ